MMPNHRPNRTIAETMTGDGLRAALAAGRRDFSGVAFSGSLDLRGHNLAGVTMPAMVDGGLSLTYCNLAGITLPQRVGGRAAMFGCDLRGVTLPQSVGGRFDLRGASNVNTAHWWREGGETRRRHCIAVSIYALIETDDGRYIAGCHDFDRAEALAHWGAPDRTDKRARLFVAAILASEVGL